MEAKAAELRLPNLTFHPSVPTNVVPEWDGVGARPTFALGSGGVATGGAIPFDVVRFTRDLVKRVRSVGSADGPDRPWLGTMARAARRLGAHRLLRARRRPTT